MVKILAETWVRPKNEITVPIQVRKLRNINPGDGLRWILDDNNCICVEKITSMIVNNHKNCGGGMVEREHKTG